MARIRSCGERIRASGLSSAKNLVGTCRGGEGSLGWRVCAAVRPCTPGAAGCPSGSADGATGMGPSGRRFPGAVAAAWLLPPSLVALSLSRQPSGLFRAGPSCARRMGFSSLPVRDGPRELVCLLWPLPSGLGHAVCWHHAVSRGRSHTGCAREPPRYFHTPDAGPCSRTPPRPPGPSHTSGEPRVYPRSRAGWRPHCRSRAVRRTGRRR
jgi:hypothetical protein